MYKFNLKRIKNNLYSRTYNSEAGKKLMHTGNCSFCDGAHLSQVIDFGDVALAGAFLKPDNFVTEKKHTLRLVFCHECFAVQVAEHAPPEALFNENYFYFSSSINTLKNHFEHYAKEISDRFLVAEKSKVLEFGCNDGVLLKPLADQGIATVIGVDASKNVLDSIQDLRLTLVNAFFTQELADMIVAKHGLLDCVMANNVYAHISDIQDATKAVHRVLKDEGIFVFEVHYLGSVLEEMQYDMIYHEHLYYYSMLSAIKHFERYDMVIFDIKHIPIHAGSVRFYVCKQGSSHAQSISPAAREMEAQERAKGFDRIETFQKFSSNVAKTRENLLALLGDLRKSGASIVGYGASGRANTMLQYCGLTHAHIDYMVDDAPAKQGYFTPGTHFEIFSSERLRGQSIPDYVLVFAWSFFEEICRRNEDYINRGGRMIVPLPEVKVSDAAGSWHLTHNIH
jgi:methylation protein EvaC